MENGADVIYIYPQKRVVSQKGKYFYPDLTGVFFPFIGLLSDTPTDNWSELLTIPTSPGNLLTDYFVLGGPGSAFINTEILTLLSVLLAHRHRAILNSPLFALILTIIGFSFFGENLYNSIPITLGVYPYAVFVNEPLSQCIMTGLSGSTLSPVVGYIILGVRFPLLIDILLGNLAGIATGLLLPSLAAQTLVFHRGSTLYNIGSTSGLTAMIFTAALRLFNYLIVENVLVLNECRFPLVWVIPGSFSLTVGTGFYYDSFRLLGIREILSSSGKLTTDFIASSGAGATLINIGLVDLMLSSHVLLVGGQLDGSVIGVILSAVGFSAFGCHLENGFPVLVGMFIASLPRTFHEITSTGIFVAAVFGTGLAPMNSSYGSFYDVIAGVLHIVLVHNISTLHEGLSLHSSGFSAGLVAGTLVPVLDNFTAVRKKKKTLGKGTIRKSRR